MSLVRIARALSRKVDALEFGAPIEYVYNPLTYARAPHEAFLEAFGQGTREVVLLGMNPGPYGMAQTGVPFGEVSMVRDWMGITGKVKQPPHVHPKRPIQGFDCTRSEVSGKRLWGWAQDRFGTAERFFERFFVVNYCPLVFMEESGRNFTPDKLPAAEREPLFEACDEALRKTVALLEPEMVVGIGAFATKMIKKVLPDQNVGTVLHPSPASPRANRGWVEAAEADFAALGIELPD